MLDCSGRIVWIGIAQAPFRFLSIVAGTGHAGCADANRAIAYAPRRQLLRAQLPLHFPKYAREYRDLESISAAGLPASLSR